MQFCRSLGVHRPVWEQQQKFQQLQSATERPPSDPAPVWAPQPKEVEVDTSAYVVSSTRGQVRWFLRPHQLQRVTAGQAGCEEKRGPGGSTQP